MGVLQKSGCLVIAGKTWKWGWCHHGNSSSAHKEMPNFIASGQTVGAKRLQA